MKDDFDELSARARRGQLGEAELRGLEQRLDGSEEASLAHRAGLEFDAEDLVLAGDEALVARINQRLLTGRRSGRSLPAGRERRSRFRAIGFVVGGICTTVAAAAAGPGLVDRAEAFWQRSFGHQDSFHALPAPSRPALPAKAAPAARLPGAPALGSAAPVDPAPVNPTPSASAAAPAPKLPPTRATRSAGARLVDSTPREPEPAEAKLSTSAALFSEASRARRQGETARAMALYAELVQRFPGAAEADSAEIALGMLSLNAGAAAQGLGHFERYLRARPQGQLAVEALWGKTRALTALGREDEARSDLMALVTRYPRSTYAAAARAQLGMPP